MPDFTSATPDLPPAPKLAQKHKAVKKVVSTETKLARLGLRTDMDLVLHLPMRYEDETVVVPIREACLRGGHVSQVEGVVTKNEISLLVTTPSTCDTWPPRRQASRIGTTQVSSS